jgi:ubiquinone/menaquinone biosynthesis C-methylase UbiE
MQKLRARESGGKRTSDAFARLFATGKRWWDVFAAADIGAERLLIANKFTTEGDEVLDVGCGRGFFSFACAKKANSVIALDSMDGGGRTGWWDEFRKTSELIGVSRSIHPVRGSATSIPFARGHFDLVASVHSIRNFRSTGEIRSFFHEAKRVVRRGGHLVVLESDLKAAGPAYRAFYSMRTKLGWELMLPSVPQMVRWMRIEGFSKVSQESLKPRLEYAPVYFPYDPVSMGDIRREYAVATKLNSASGESSPPVFFLTATR